MLRRALVLGSAAVLLIPTARAATADEAGPDPGADVIDVAAAPSEEEPATEPVDPEPGSPEARPTEAVSGPAEGAPAAELAGDPVAGPPPLADEAPGPEPVRVAPVAAPDAALPAELVVLLNGAPFEGEHGNRIDACTIELALSGLGATPEAPVVVGAEIWAIPPTVAEGSRTLLVDEQVPATADALDLDYPMTDRLAVYDIKTNGYRLAVQVTVAGEPLGERQVWLGCGADQTGHPDRILIDKTWLDEDGAVVTDLDAVLPAGWRDTFAIGATSSRGSAHCTYPPGSDVLVCEYDNPGHGPKPGLVVPNGKKHTYEVVEVGLPEGWEVDPATVGVFLGRETCDDGQGCGGGGGHDDGGGGHDDGGCGGHTAGLAAAEVSAAEEGGGGGTTCTHAVVNLQLPVVPPEPPEPPEPPAPQDPPDPTVTPAPTGTSVLGAGVTAGGAVQARTTLPATGATITPLVAVALGLLALGGAAEGIARLSGRRRICPTRVD
jgi:hypothetical protein